MNSEIHNEVKAITTRLDNTVYLNDHSANHVKMVMVKVSSILKDCSYLTHMNALYYWSRFKFMMRDISLMAETVMKNLADIFWKI